MQAQLHVPACPTSKKNHMLPVRFITMGTAYPGLLNNPSTVKKAFAICRESQDRFGSVIDG